MLHFWTVIAARRTEESLLSRDSEDLGRMTWNCKVIQWWRNKGSQEVNGMTAMNRLVLVQKIFSTVNKPDFELKISGFKYFSNSFTLASHSTFLPFN